MKVGSQPNGSAKQSQNEGNTRTMSLIMGESEAGGAASGGPGGSWSSWVSRSTDTNGNAGGAGGSNGQLGTWGSWALSSTESSGTSGTPAWSTWLPGNGAIRNARSDTDAKDRSYSPPGQPRSRHRNFRSCMANPGVHTMDMVREGLPTLSKHVLGEAPDADLWVDSYADWMLVFPLLTPEQKAKSPKLSGYRDAQWYLKQIVVDDAIFTREQRTLEHVHAGQNSGVHEDEEHGTATSYGAQVDKAHTTPKEAAKRFIVKEADDQGMEVDPHLVRAYDAAKEARTFAELQERVCELMLRFLVCKHCGFQARAFKSIDGDELFVAVNATEDILQAHADKVEYHLQIDAHLSVKLLRGAFQPEEVSPPILRYDCEADRRFRKRHKVSAQRSYTDVNKKGSIFRGVDRLRIIGVKLTKVFNMDCMVDFGVLNVYYPLHQKAALTPLASEWADWKGLCRFSPKPYEVPLMKIRNYFGENLAFRVCHLSFQTQWLLPLALASPLVFVLNQSPARPSVMMLISITMIVWAATFSEFWKRKEAHYRLLWGMENYHAFQHARPEFKGDWKLSPVDRFTSVKIDKKQWIWRAMTTIITCFFIGCVISTTCILYAYEAHLQANGHESTTSMINILIAIQMRAYTFLWQYLSIWLTNFDNYEIESEYFEALVFRVFGFQFINSFAALFYTALFKNLTHHCPDPNVCSREVAFQLRVLFGMNFIFHGLSMALPYLSFKFSVWKETYFAEAPVYTEEKKSLLGFRRRSIAVPQDKADQKKAGESMSFQEAQAKLPKYDAAQEVWDRIDVVVELGYVLFFGFLAPDLIFLSFVSNVLRVKALGWTLVHAQQRPSPKGAQGIGNVYHKIYRFMGRAAVMCNLILMLVYNAQCPRDEDYFLWLRYLVSTPEDGSRRQYDWKSMLVVFLLFDRLIVICQEAIDFIIPDESEAVHLERKRRQVIEHRYHMMMYDVQFGHELAEAFNRLPPRIRDVHALSETDRGVEWIGIDATEVSQGFVVKPWNPADAWFQRKDDAKPR